MAVFTDPTTARTLHTIRAADFEHHAAERRRSRARPDGAPPGRTSFRPLALLARGARRLPLLGSHLHVGGRSAGGYGARGSIPGGTACGSGVAG